MVETGLGMVVNDRAMVMVIEQSWWGGDEHQDSGVRARNGPEHVVLWLVEVRRAKNGLGPVVSLLLVVVAGRLKVRMVSNARTMGKVVEEYFVEEEQQ